MTVVSGSYLRMCDNENMPHNDLVARVKYLEKLEVVSRDERRKLIELLAVKQAEIDDINTSRPLELSHEAIALMHTMRLRGFTLADIALLTGSNPNTVRRRLLETA